MKTSDRNDDFRYMKIHIFALRWRDEIKRSSQLRTQLKRVVVNRTCWLVRMFIWTQFIDQLPVGLLAQLVERCTGIAEVMGFKSRTGLNFFQVLFTTTLFSSVLNCEAVGILKMSHFVSTVLLWKYYCSHSLARVTFSCVTSMRTHFAAVSRQRVFPMLC